MSLGVSIVICCHNSAERLPRTLDFFRRQPGQDVLPWEIVVVDNASTDPTADVARREWPARDPAELRVVTEPVPGLGHARMRGVQAAQHELICFVDDDNWVAPDWLTRIRAFFEAHPEVAACGGRAQAVPEIEPPSWFGSIQACYAVGPQFPAGGDITDSTGSLLWGAGLTVRKSAFLQLIARGFRFRTQGRTGTNLLCGEDTELCFALRAAGWRLWYDDGLILQHYLPRQRLTWRYALRLVRGTGNASVLLTLYDLALKTPSFQHYPGWKKTWAFQMLKACWAWLTAAGRRPLDALRRHEGSREALKLEAACGRIETLWRIAPTYATIYRELARDLGPGENPPS